jgi:endonuclease YncB( thermonuclease family)
MVIRPVVCGSTEARPHVPRSFRRVHVLFGALLLGSLPLAAQTAENPATGQPSAQDPVPVTTPPVVTAPPPAAAPGWARVVVDEAKLRCWSGAVASPPVFEDVLSKDSIVETGRSENGFRLVVLPLGPVGYVSKKFTESSADGQVVTKGNKVSFRFRAQTSDAPVAQLDAGTVLHVVGEKDDWYRVRVAGVDCWLAEAEIASLDSSDPLVLQNGKVLRQKHEDEVQARKDQVAAELAKIERNKADLAAVKVIEDGYALEAGKPPTLQQYAPLLEAIEKLSATLAEDSAAKGPLAALARQIETRRWIVEADALRKSEPPAAAPIENPLPPDRLERFESVGWLRYESRFGGPGVYYLEKGGRRQFVLTCNTGRYDLSLFVGREIGVIGPRRQPPQESMSLLDAERIEVLGQIVR